MDRADADRPATTRAGSGSSPGGPASPPAGQRSGSLAAQRPWAGRRVLLGVTGGIAAYKAAMLARDLTCLGASVDVVLTAAAREFVGAITFQALTGRAVHCEMFGPGAGIDHIRLAREADVVCVAPATADLIARAAGGRADDLLTAILLATEAPVLLCPAMNDRMYGHRQTQLNIEHLRVVLGYELIGPAVGPLAAGEGVGPGRMEEPATIIEFIGRALEQAAPYCGSRVIVTAGPTREALDPVRFISNRSSGRMGFALAAAAWRRGASVTLIAGPTSVPPPVGPELVRVETAAEMEVAVREALPAADALIMAAAVADFRPASNAAVKIRKADVPSSLALEPTIDILSDTVDNRPDGLAVVGFALETTDALENARRKLADKQLDMIVLNDLGEPGAGFEVETNKVVLLQRQAGEEVLPLLPKNEVAERILDRLAPLMCRHA